MKGAKDPAGTVGVPTAGSLDSRMAVWEGEVAISTQVLPSSGPE